MCPGSFSTRLCTSLTYGKGIPLSSRYVVLEVEKESRLARYG